jgi:hypothetical protein
MRIVKAMVFAASFLSMLGTASAQMGMGMRQTPMPHGIFSPVVGTGAAYDITNTDGRKSSVEYAIVGKESVNGKDAYWMEFTTNGGSGTVIMKMLTSVGEATASRVIMQLPGRPPMEMPQQMMKNMTTTNSQSIAADIRTSSEDLGGESVTVPAGIFACEHYRAKDGSGDTWVSTKVAPFGVVKHQGKDAIMVLTKLITDAKDKIVGVPQPFNPMGMMQQPPQQ